MFNHIDDVKEKLGTKTGIGALPCATNMLNAINRMEDVLKKYYSKTALPTVYESQDGDKLAAGVKVCCNDQPQRSSFQAASISVPVNSLFHGISEQLLRSDCAI